MIQDAIKPQMGIIKRGLRGGLLLGLVIGLAEGLSVLFLGSVEPGFLVGGHFLLLAMVLYGGGGAAGGAICGSTVAAGGSLVRLARGGKRDDRRMAPILWGMMAGGVLFLYIRLYFFKDHPALTLVGLIILLSLVFILVGKFTRARRAPRGGLKRPILFLGVSAICWALSLLLLSMGEEARPPDAAVKKKRPNVVIFTLDTLRADHLGCMGYKKIKTPVLDGLAEKGLLFTRNICQQ
ncbi:MAG: sulfatase-like hydrolase/transferase, partial [Desulfobacterales bacterium]|nr:sulfatase-like hydrolase/transferase [Desulfobacterales bacterium]